MEEERCIICLDAPLQENPLLLLACGCKTAWFHRSCQISWMIHVSYPLKCPTCKRLVPMHLHYAYHPSFGQAQHKLRMIFLLGAAESLLAMTLWGQYKFQTGIDIPETLLIPIQSILLLNLPRILHSQYDILTAINHVCYKNAFQILYLVFYHLRRGWYSHLNIPNHTIILIFLGCMHILVFGLQILESRYVRYAPPIDPLTPFLVGYDTIYVRQLDFIEPPPNTSERPRRLSTQ